MESRINVPALVVVAVCGSAFAQESAPPPPAPIVERSIEVRVDSRVELLSIVFRLAGNPEYNQGRFTSYLDEIETHFGEFRAHAVIASAKRLRQSRGVSYDAVMSMAVHLTEELDETEPLDDEGTALDRRWRPDEARAFLAELRGFAQETEFAAFFDAHRGLYALCEARMRAMLNKHAHVDWFDGFFGGRPNASFTLIPALVNGGQNYGPRLLHADGREEFFAVMGVWLFDEDGLPLFDRRVLPTVVHEFCHSYVNDTVARHRDALRASGEAIFPKVEAGMRRQAYANWQTMINESIVRASVIQYVLAHDGAEAAERQIVEEESRQFLWIRDLVVLLGEYEASRDRNPAFADFMPRVTEFFEGTAAAIDE